MKVSVGKFVVIALGLLTIGLCAGHAQIMNELTFEMSQPFVVADATLPAGSYIVRPVAVTDTKAIEIVSTSGHPSVMVEAVPVRADTPEGGSHLIFNKYQKVLALSEIFPGGGNSGFQLIPGHSEKLAAKTETPTKQTVAATSK